MNEAQNNMEQEDYIPEPLGEDDADTAGDIDNKRIDVTNLPPQENLCIKWGDNNEIILSSAVSSITDLTNLASWIKENIIPKEEDKSKEVKNPLM